MRTATSVRVTEHLTSHKKKLFYVSEGTFIPKTNIGTLDGHILRASTWACVNTHGYKEAKNGFKYSPACYPMRAQYRHCV